MILFIVTTESKEGWWWGRGARNILELDFPVGGLCKKELRSTALAHDTTA